MHMDNIIREQNAQAAAQQRQIQANQNAQRQQQIQEGYRRIGELGRDIGNGTLWPTPRHRNQLNRHHALVWEVRL
jgi:flagellar biosynthesis/type III secretory pathway protein FliH